MDLDISYKPNYFMYAQLFIRHIENYVKKHPDVDNAIFDLRDIYDLFRQDKASVTTNLDGIMNLVDAYKIETINGDKQLVQSYKINVTDNSILLDFDAEAVNSLKNGGKIITPDATSTN